MAVINSNISKRIYDRSPVFVQNLAVSLYGYHLRRREFGPDFERFLEEFEAQQWLSATDLEVLQVERLRFIIKHAWNQVPWYRQLFENRGLNPNSIGTLDDLQKLPFTTSQDILDNNSLMVSKAATRADLIVGHTSGTTGKARNIFYDRQVCVLKNVVEWRMRRTAGISLGDPVAHMVGRQIVPIDQGRPPFWRFNRALNSIYLSNFHFTKEWQGAYINAIRDFGTVAFDGYPATLSMLARAMDELGQTVPLRAAFVSSEVLLPWQRDSIASAFQCPVFDYYGMAERAVFATECEFHSGLHVNSDFGHVELLDKEDSPVPPGVPGRIVVTGWYNTTMPFIRYKTNDWATWATTPCPCGRGFPLLKSVEGRLEDMLATSDGRFLEASFAYPIFEAVQAKLLQSQIYQDASKAIVLRVVPHAEFGDDDARWLVREIKRYVGHLTPVNVEFHDQISCSQSGKFRWVISDASPNDS
ncbi:phenylacetate--CoA ligase family protein [Wenzhouxiangella sp. XN24]|uniref:phenylacetate--CoA ligase family protein n=1 Tax=Wenzhouxiangella sp. XN24 TaxID=2713569 RepID=UPI0013EA8470|nr:phenylacetate--CoA ligase family protein [Wenzhouxiangella sp. XN24]NGX17085.1 phenylacetate--CoA ligase family protein [Wenzhouxiangella sp. XN24]